MYRLNNTIIQQYSIFSIRFSNCLVVHDTPNCYDFGSAIGNIGASCQFKFTRHCHYHRLKTGYTSLVHDFRPVAVRFVRRFQR